MPGGTRHNPQQPCVCDTQALSLTPLATSSISGVWYGRTSGDREQTVHRTYSSLWESNNSTFLMCFPRTGSTIVTNTLCNYFLKVMVLRRVQHSTHFAIKLDFRSIFLPYSPPHPPHLFHRENFAELWLLQMALCTISISLQELSVSLQDLI